MVGSFSALFPHHPHLTPFIHFIHLNNESLHRVMCLPKVSLTHDLNIADSSQLFPFLFFFPFLFSPFFLNFSTKLEITSFTCISDCASINRQFLAGVCKTMMAFFSILLVFSFRLIFHYCTTSIFPSKVLQVKGEISGGKFVFEIPLQ